MRAPSHSEHIAYSRFQVISQGEPAWVDDPTHGRYYFDGLRFWHLLAERPDTLEVSWRTPAFGWAHDERCQCGLCAADAVPAATLGRPWPEEQETRRSA